MLSLRLNQSLRKQISVSESSASGQKSSRKKTNSGLVDIEFVSTVQALDYGTNTRVGSFNLFRDLRENHITCISAVAQ